MLLGDIIGLSTKKICKLKYNFFPCFWNMGVGWGMGIVAEFHLLPRFLMWLNLSWNSSILLPQSECWHHPAWQNDFKAGKKLDKETDRVAKALSPCGKQQLLIQKSSMNVTSSPAPPRFPGGLTPGADARPGLYH